jgi:Rrf2 family iron-sulfur cluster assembly transcriptional regulator
VTHPVEEERCSASHHCSIRPVWMLLQQKIDDVLEGVHLSDLLADESVVRQRVGLDRVGLPVLQA